jgi:hypothetical protein
MSRAAVIILRYPEHYKYPIEPFGSWLTGLLIAHLASLG